MHGRKKAQEFMIHAHEGTNFSIFGNNLEIIYGKKMEKLSATIGNRRNLTEKPRKPRFCDSRLNLWQICRC